MEVVLPYSPNMTVQGVRGDPTGAVRWGSPWKLAVVALTIMAAAAGFAGGAAWEHHRTELGAWHTAVAHTGLKQIAIEYDGWTYGASDSVASWLDRRGSMHDAGWPDCLDVPAGHQVTVRFQARVVTIDGHTSRPIVAIDCRPAE